MAHFLKKNYVHCHYEQQDYVANFLCCEIIDSRNIDFYNKHHFCAFQLHQIIHDFDEYNKYILGTHQLKRILYMRGLLASTFSLQRNSLTSYWCYLLTKAQFIMPHNYPCFMSSKLGTANSTIVILAQTTTPTQFNY